MTKAYSLKKKDYSASLFPGFIIKPALQFSSHFMKIGIYEMQYRRKLKY